MKPAKPNPTADPAYRAGFERACLLIFGCNRAVWTRDDLRLRNKITRKLFGRKRQPPRPC